MRLSQGRSSIQSLTTITGFVGHIIGLGDRHGSNILVDQLTWGALHIDFGDVSGAVIATTVLLQGITDTSALRRRPGASILAGKGALSPVENDDKCIRGQ